jgi:uncharacterized protein (TIGR01777 family)
MHDHRKLVLPGGSGFLGHLLARWFGGRGWDVITLTRRPDALPPAGRSVNWDGRTLGDWARELDGADAVVNLAGRSVNCRYHARNRRLIMDSRVESTHVVGEAIARCANPPAVWLNSSTATIYRHSCDRPMHELTGECGPHPEAKDAFSLEVAHAWEGTFNAAVTPRTRKVLLRTAMVFADVPGTVYQVLRRLARLGLGGKMGHGRQYVSWIHADDFCRAVEWLVEREDLLGPVNVAAPNPLTNAEMMRLLRRHVGMPFGLPAARWMLEVGAFFLRTETELIVKSRRVVPRRLLESGFTFSFERLEEALGNLNARPTRPASRTCVSVPLRESSTPPMAGRRPITPLPPPRSAGPGSCGTGP